MRTISKGSEKRAEILDGLREYFARIDRQRQPVSDEEADEIINEALRSTRPNYRPACTCMSQY